MGPSEVATFEQLPATERLVLITLRARHENCRGTASLETLYRIACGLAWVEPAVASFESMACALIAGRRRTLAIEELAATRVSPDEQCVMALLASCQLGEQAQTRARACWLVRSQFVESLKLHAETFAHTLAGSGCELSSRWLHQVRSRRHGVEVAGARRLINVTRTATRRDA